MGGFGHFYFSSFEDPAAYGISRFIGSARSFIGGEHGGHKKTGRILASGILNLNSPLFAAGMNSNDRYRSFFYKAWRLNPMGLRENSEIPCSLLQG